MRRRTHYACGVLPTQRHGRLFKRLQQRPRAPDSLLPSAVTSVLQPPPLSLDGAPTAPPGDVPALGAGVVVAELSGLAAELSRLAQLGTDATADDAAEQRDALRELASRVSWRACASRGRLSVLLTPRAYAPSPLQADALSRRARAQPPSPLRWFGNQPSDACDALNNVAGCEVLVARSWEELNSFLFLDSWDERIGKHRLRHVFRGSGNASAHTLRTSIQRLGDLSHIRTVEPAMIRAFRRYAAACVAGGAVAASTGAGGAALGRDASVWEWLTVAQHHGLPTRLLDWTHNPMIAAHFVTDHPEDLGHDGAIWCVDPAGLNSRSEEFRRWNLGRPQGAKVLGVFAIEQLEEYCHDNAPAHAKPGSRISSLEMFDATQLRCAFLEPPSIDARLVHQSGLFSALSPDCDMDALLTASPSCARKVIIPSWLKREVRDKLDAIGVSERTLFPGLDGLCTWLRRYYTKEARPQPRKAQQQGGASARRHSEDGGASVNGEGVEDAGGDRQPYADGVTSPSANGEPPVGVLKPQAQRPLYMLGDGNDEGSPPDAPTGLGGDDRSFYARRSGTPGLAWGDGL